MNDMDFASLYKISPEEAYGPEAGEYFADLDEETAMYCVFNQKGKAVSSWASMEQAEKDAETRNMRVPSFSVVASEHRVMADDDLPF